MRRCMTDTLPVATLVYHLLVTGFITGILDATTYADFGTFTSNQTGNTVLLGIGALDLVPIRMVDIATSLSSFLVTVVVCGQAVNVLAQRNGRVRWWTLVTATYQTVTVLLVAILLYARVLRVAQPDGDSSSWSIILLLASSAGAQVAMAKQFGIPEIPTAMLTSPFADVLTDPHLFSWSFGKSYNVSRNRRLAYIASLCVGVFIGAAIHKRQGTAAVLLLAGCLKIPVTLSFYFVAAEKVDA